MHEKIRVGDYVRLISPGEYQVKYPFLVCDLVNREGISYVGTYIREIVGRIAVEYHRTDDVEMVHKCQFDPPIPDLPDFPQLGEQPHGFD